MRDFGYYYSEIWRELNAYDASAAGEFDIYSKSHAPREVFLWLESRRVNGQLPLGINSLLTDFYWEIV
ncbi:hypothetical protein NK553_04120 [Pseudomonas sp. ZM23]|uniref:Uncharacterized protein n=1 Tax=Pseudomonas triclosanedens TaxID=2961893 RepID=A0ABY6ZV71_9PSED|nr:hypothetical protein [Pseudomonas triclosanedens]MCP8463127.1 hypothetical protein [Pseudomonas triclosanedens]MCP8469814.1 hypothetical protein [Pseudomonas triclosanedens]MCP8473928.1 hypothetical protein [Pseudomonas triclosanedens]WAI48673.1 hypothetical protein OU419_23380 [Pseudomonas triclosanedens]